MFKSLPQDLGGGCPSSLDPCQPLQAAVLVTLFSNAARDVIKRNTVVHLIMRVILLTTPDTRPNELLLIDEFFRRGLNHLHVRKPSWPLEHMRHFVSHIDQAHRGAVVLHSHHRLHEEFHIGVRYTL